MKTGLSINEKISQVNPDKQEINRIADLFSILKKIDKRIEADRNCYKKHQTHSNENC